MGFENMKFSSPSDLLEPGSDARKEVEEKERAERDPEQERMMLDLAAGLITREQLTTWLEAHTALPLPSNKRFYIAGRETEKQDDISMGLMIDMVEKIDVKRMIRTIVPGKKYSR